KAAFTVTRKKNEYPRYNSPLIFTEQLINLNSDFNIQTGYFTCKIPGMYYFVFHFVSEGDLCVKLMSDNSARVTLSFCDFNKRTSSVSQVMSGGFVIELAKGNKVWIQPFKNPEHNTETYKMSKTEKSVFNGFLIFATGSQGKIGSPGDPGPAGPPGPPGDKGDTSDSKLHSAFCVARETYEHPAPKTPIMFPKVITNVKNHFNVNEGKFVCQIPGTYYFVYHATSTKTLCVRLFVDGKAQFIFCDHIQAQYNLSSGGISVYLKHNSKVWLETTDLRVNGMYSAGDKGNSVFSGFLLY
ncbi:complement C1q subcomponent subunit C, partial [Silurus meridionalis]